MPADTLDDSLRDLLARLKDDQRARWRRNEPRLLEVYLAEHPAVAANAEAVLELLYNEVVLRKERGETPRPEDYTHRCPHLSDEIARQFAADALLDTLESSVAESCAPSTEPSPVSLPTEIKALPVVPGYRIDRKLGQGGMGIVYLAHQLHPPRTVALKMIRKGSVAGPDELVRFVAEAEVVAGLEHANIVRLWQVGEHEGLPFFTLEYVSGGSLHDRLDGRPLPPMEAARIVEQVARAVASAHERGVIHRDLKPANVLLGADGVPKVTDFGLARRVEAGSGLTATGHVMGTPSYMAPEQARGRNSEVGPLSDVYALGAVLYECLTGRPPFAGPTTFDTLEQVVNVEPVSPRSLNPSVSRDLETVCLKCLEKEPGRRYASALHLAEDLRRFQDGETIVARPLGVGGRMVKWARRRPAVAALLGLLLLTLTGAAVGGVLYTVHLDELRHAAERDQERAEKGETDALDARNKADDLRKRAEKGEQDARDKQTEAKKQAAEAKKQLALTRTHLLTSQLQRVAAVYERYPTRGLELLQDTRGCPVDLREAAWHYYYNRCRVFRHVLAGHAEDVDALAFSPDGKLLAAGTGEESGPVAGQRKMTGEVRLWDPLTGKQKAILAGHKEQVFAVAFSPDGKQLASSSRDGTIRLWSVATGQQQRLFNVQARSIAYTPDGGTLLAGDEKVHRIDLGTGQVKVLLESVVGASAFSPDGKLIATRRGDIGERASVHLWDALTGKEIRVLRGHTRHVWQLAFTRDSKRLASAGGEYHNSRLRMEARIWDVATGEILQTLRGDSERIECLAFSPDGRSLAIGSTLWDLESAQVRVSFLGHTDNVMSVAFSPDGRLLATGSRDQTARIWDLQAGQAQQIELPESSGYIALSPDGKTLAVGDYLGVVTFLDLASGKKVGGFEDKKAGLSDLRFSDDGKTLQLVCADRAIHVWDRETSQRLRRTPLEGLGESFDFIARFSPDGAMLATSAKDNTVRLWDTATGKEFKQLKTQQRIASLAWSPDGRQVAAGTQKWNQWKEAWVEVWDVALGDLTRRRVGVHPVNFVLAAVTAVAFSPDGKLLASADEEGTIRLWNLATLEMHTLKGHLNIVFSLTFSRDGKTLVSAMGNSDGLPGEIRLWNVETGQERARLGGQTSSVFRVLFSRDEERLISSTGDKRIWIWDLSRPQREP